MDPLLYLVIVNALTFAMYWQDKRAAKNPGAARVPEATLLLIGFFGGTPAALIAQRVLRHKTRKTSFQVKFWGVTFAQIALLLFQPHPIPLILTRAFG